MLCSATTPHLFCLCVVQLSILISISLTPSFLCYAREWAITWWYQHYSCTDNVSTNVNIAERSSFYSLISFQFSLIVF
ncbi:hypothetical protein PIB30_052473 [Stylosanthes scabra]|uniref:Secreted protein n=1 Tax=Stylosanthes scabra TaxID=79078 RepID=A0ABU6RIS7_9FABA|nr:hypothetical protein [Stylosanthes scabra]